MIFNRLQILVTTFCNRKCPHCCYRIPQHETLAEQHYDWAYFERAATALAGLDVLYVSGGEATMHPEFPRIASSFRDMFQAKCMALVTNGYGLLQHESSLQHFDKVWVAYLAKEHSPEDQQKIARLEAGSMGLVSLTFAHHIPLSKPGGGKPCYRHGFIGCAEGRVWPCCAGPGMREAQSIPIEAGCKDRLKGIPVPCATCAFSL